jgi:hypothetical protein
MPKSTVENIPEMKLSTIPAPSIALIGPGYGVGENADRFKYDSLPKEIVKKHFGTETRHLGFIAQKSSFAKNQPLSTDEPPVRAQFGVGFEVAASQNANRFKYDSLPKEIIEKNFGTETKHLGFIDQRSTLVPKQTLSVDRSPAVAKIGTGYGTDENRNRFKYDSLSKEIVAKNFGTETRKLGFIDQRSTMIPKQANSQDRSPAIAKIGTGYGTDENRNRFKYDSLSKEIVAKNFGTETKHLGFIDQRSTLIPKQASSQDRSPAICKFGGSGYGSPTKDRFAYDR